MNSSTATAQDVDKTALDTDIIFRAMKETATNEISVYFTVTSDQIDFEETIGLPEMPNNEVLEGAIESTAWTTIRTAFPMLQANNVSGVVEFTPDDPTGAGPRIRVITFILTGAEHRYEASVFPDFPTDYAAEIAGLKVSLADRLPSLAAYRAEINRLMAAFQMELIEISYDCDDESRPILEICYKRGGVKNIGLRGTLPDKPDDKAGRFAAAYLERVVTDFVQKFFEENGGAIRDRRTELPGSGFMQLSRISPGDLMVNFRHQHRVVTTSEKTHSFLWDEAAQIRHFTIMEE